MTRSQIFISATLVVFAWVTLVASSAQAQLYTIPWYTIDNGGGYSNGGNFELEGTIGQHDAGPVMTGGNFSLRGGFWVGAVGPFTVVPDSFLVTRGTYVSGGIPELRNSDNADLSIRRASSDIQARTEFTVNSFSPLANPSAFEVTLEGSVFARSPINQSIELYDYVAANWVLVDTRPAAQFIDSTVTVAATGNLSRFVQPVTRSIQARIRYQSVSPRQQFASNTDLFIWTIQ
jgi:hypothetical protein